MMAICPVGPPKLMKPSLSQKRKASRKHGCAEVVGSLFTAAECWLESARPRGRSVRRRASRDEKSLFSRRLRGLILERVQNDETEATALKFARPSSSHVEQAVRERYSQAAQARADALCCPIEYDRQYLAVIPP